MEDIRVLLVDDEEDFASALAERLNLRGIRTSISCRGEEALAMIASDPPQVVVLDMNMPGLGGKEILAGIRSDHPGIGVIVLTGMCPPEVERAGAGSGFCDYLMKPVDIDELIRKIGSAVGKKLTGFPPSRE